LILNLNIRGLLVLKKCFRFSSGTDISSGSELSSSSRKEIKKSTKRKLDEQFNVVSNQLKIKNKTPTSTSHPTISQTPISKSIRTVSLTSSCVSKNVRNISQILNKSNESSKQNTSTYTFNQSQSSDNTIVESPNVLTIASSFASVESPSQQQLTILFICFNII
jgi:hypothetical protein